MISGSAVYRLTGVVTLSCSPMLKKSPRVINLCGPRWGRLENIVPPTLRALHLLVGAHRFLLPLVTKGSLRAP